LVGSASGARGAPSIQLAAFQDGKSLGGTPLILQVGKDYPSQSWIGYATLLAELLNTGSTPLKLELSLQAKPGASEFGESVTYAATLAPGTRATWRIPLLHLRYSRAREWPSQAGITDMESEGALPSLGVGAIRLMARPDGAARLIRLELKDRVVAQGWVDRYGQRCCLEWPGKIGKDGDLVAAENREQDELKQSPADPNLDEYRAWKERPARKATRFFRVERIDGRWWFIAPNGRLFYAQGMDSVVAGIDHRLDAASHGAYAWLPPKDGDFSAAWGHPPGNIKDAEPDWPSFYRVNLIRKWGPSAMDRFRERALSRLSAWGFTCLGNWSDEKLLEQRKFPYVSVGPQTWKLWDKVSYVLPQFQDAFHPNYESGAREVSKELARYKDDPWLIGYFLENELDWDELPVGVFKLPETAPAKAWFLKLLKKQYSSIAKLNAAWKTNATSFESLRWPEDREPTALARKDMGKFMSEFAERWYGAWSRAMRAADPNHLLLGDRYAHELEWEEVVAACARHMDVISINYYANEPPRRIFEHYAELAKKPLLIGEFGFNSLDAGLLTAAVPVLDQHQRGVGYRYYSELAASMPYVVGAHYFQYLDEPVTGRSDRETSFNGFVTVADTTASELVRAARETNPRLYRVHAGEEKPGGTEPRR
jgi:hypothetical protein